MYSLYAGGVVWSEGGVIVLVWRVTAATKITLQHSLCQSLSVFFGVATHQQRNNTFPSCVELRRKFVNGPLRRGPAPPVARPPPFPDLLSGAWRADSRAAARSCRHGRIPETHGRSHAGPAGFRTMPFANEPSSPQSRCCRVRRRLQIAVPLT